ncbi:hypothetical protein D2V08_05250 [Flagellimonas lutimaris]|uniref:Uncharacterized protein n=2 Tax=Flagellimonas lutimaris TaxID=475082 RepID=A0A3A1N7Y0_9FLAO|nr:hypothetical protein D2V08_05250 [Allomuricauda lutimaris]
MDAHNSNWRSSGLLYYYSFLNLAKALTVTSRFLRRNYLSTNSVFHGLSAQPQNINRIID